MKRFSTNFNTINDAKLYYQERAIQSLPVGWSWNGEIFEKEWGGYTFFKDSNNDIFVSPFVYSKYIGNGYLLNWINKENTHKIITSDYCDDMRLWLQKKKIQHSVIPKYKNSYLFAYNLIAKYYSDTKAKRSGLYYINHIEEGIYILEKIGADSDTISAWCIHPMMQSDDDFKNFYENNLFKNIPSNILLLGAEYRNIANAHLSRHYKKIPKLSSITQVNEMLIADKIQNKKDFECYVRHADNAQRLCEYFDEWFCALNISQKTYEEFSNDIMVKTGREEIFKKSKQNL
jgi:hypothetical protein